jgi:hypothetical protein
MVPSAFEAEEALGEDGEHANDPHGPNDPNDPNDPDDEGAQVSKFQLESLYSAVQDHYRDIPQQEPPASLKTTLRPYQKQALHWMGARESSTPATVRQRHPLWDEYNVGDFTFYASPFSMSLSLDFPQATGAARGGNPLLPLITLITLLTIINLITLMTLITLITLITEKP